MTSPPLDERPALVGLTPGEAPVSVLLVDDDADFRTLSRLRLTRHGFAVETATSGEEALARIAGGAAVDLVLLDYRLPGVDGLETLRRLSDPDGPSVVIATGEGSEAVAVEALRAGAVDYLPKDTRFLEQLPGVMARAWQVHDLGRRSRAVQRLAVMVTSETDRQTMLSDIVGGAHRLLRASGCAVFVAGEAGLALESVAGELPLDVAELHRSVRGFVERGMVPDFDDPRILVLALHAPGDPALGALVAHLPGAGPLPAEERLLAEAFASFAGIAIANVAKLDIEREMVQRLHELVDSRRQFVTSVSHELRTPLTCIQGFAATLLAHDDELTTQERRESLQAVLDHAAELNALVEQLLEAARIESGRLAVDPVPTDLGAAVDAAVVLLGPVLGDRRIVRRLRPVQALCDPVLLHRVLANLLSNAAKYSAVDATITVEVRADGTDAVVEVADDGIGIGTGDLARIFEPFWRAGGPLRDRVRGAGIGLALVQEYVTAMAGRIDVESQPDEGSTFRIFLPSCG